MSYRRTSIVDQLIELTVPKRNSCWSNSFWALVGYVVNGESILKTFYVEGWLLVADGRVALEHAWLEIEGEIVDVTLPGKYADSSYHPAYKLSARSTIDAVLGELALPLFACHIDYLAQMDEVFATFPKSCSKIQLAASFAAQFKTNAARLKEEKHP